MSAYKKFRDENPMYSQNDMKEYCQGVEKRCSEENALLTKRLFEIESMYRKETDTLKSWLLTQEARFEALEKVIIGLKNSSTCQPDLTKVVYKFKQEVTTPSTDDKPKMNSSVITKLQSKISDQQQQIEEATKSIVKVRKSRLNTAKLQAVQMSGGICVASRVAEKFARPQTGGTIIRGMNMMLNKCE